MELTEIKVFPVQEEKLKAFVSVVIDHCFMVNDIKVIQGREGLFISMPSRRKKNGQFKDVAHPLNNPTRQMMEGLILTEYRAALRGESTNAPRRSPAAGPASNGHHATPPMAAVEPSPPAEEKPESAETNGDGPSLREVAEKHLRDDFWTD